MPDTIKASAVFLVLVFILFLPKVSYAWGDQHGRDDARARHEHRFHPHNPDLTLVTGMDDIDTRVLVDPAPDPIPEEVDQPVPVEDSTTAPSLIITPDADGNFVVNVPNNAGGHTPIRIVKSGNGYVGPKGELYYPFPEVSQLKAMYGI